MENLDSKNTNLIKVIENHVESGFFSNKLDGLLDSYLDQKSQNIFNYLVDLVNLQFGISLSEIEHLMSGQISEKAFTVLPNMVFGDPTDYSHKVTFGEYSFFGKLQILFDKNDDIVGHNSFPTDYFGRSFDVPMITSYLPNKSKRDVVLPNTVNLFNTDKIDEKNEFTVNFEGQKDFMGYEFTNNDLSYLQQKGTLKDAVEVEKDGKIVEGFISLDPVKNELSFLAKSDIVINENVLSGNKLSSEQRQMLVSGYPVVFPGFEKDGNKSTVKIEIDRLNGGTKLSDAVSGKALLNSKSNSIKETISQEIDQKKTKGFKV